MTDKELIELYSHSSGTSEANDAFRSWIVASQDNQSKEKALRDLWDTTPSDCDIKMPKAGKVYSIARKTERALSGHTQTFTFLPWAIAAACVVIAIASIFMLRPEPVTRLVASSEAKGYFTLPDGSSVWLNKGSSLFFKGNLDGRKRIVSLDGEAFFDVSHSADHPFIVQSKDMDVTVTGTRFTVTSYPEKSGAVYLEEGAVTVSGDAFPATQLTPGQGIVFDDNTLSWKKVPIVAKDHTCWTQDHLVFLNTPLSDIFISLEHWYHISLICPDNDFLERTRISMTVRQETPENVLESIAILTGISYSKEDGNRYVVRK